MYSNVLILHSSEDVQSALIFEEALDTIGLKALSKKADSFDEHSLNELRWALEYSPRFIFILSDDINLSDWMSFELGALLGRMLSEWDKPNIIFVFLGGASEKILPVRLSSFKYVKADNATEAKEKLLKEIQSAGVSAA